MSAPLTLTEAPAIPQAAAVPTAFALLYDRHHKYAVEETHTGVLMVLFTSQAAAQRYIDANAALFLSGFGYLPVPFKRDLQDISEILRFVSLDGHTADLSLIVPRQSPAARRAA